MKEETRGGHGPKAYQQGEGSRTQRTYQQGEGSRSSKAYQQAEGSRGPKEYQQSGGSRGSEAREGVRGRSSGGPKQGEGAKEKKHKLCPVSAKCGGCRWINIGYKEQLEAKATRFRRQMEPYCKPEPLIAMEEPTHYRNKVHAVFGIDSKHNIISGIYEEKSHRIVPVDSCLIENQKADEIILSIRGLLKS